MTEITAETLAGALARLQADLPEVRKGETAEVQTKTGSKFRYSYADLADVSKAVLPKLGKLGLSWITRPTVNEQGKFVLAYELLHVSGESKTGEYPLQLGTPQEIGSAITYARRYTLCSVTGVAPASDDDDAAAAARSGGYDEWETAQPRPTPRMQTIAKASKMIHAADTKGKLDRLGWLVTERETEGAITADDAVNLRRQIVTRLDVLFPAGEKRIDEAEPMVDQKQQRHMHALFRDVGLGGTGDREMRLTKTALIVGRDVDSSTHLTAAEADKVIAALEAERKAAKEVADASQSS